MRLDDRRGDAAAEGLDVPAHFHALAAADGGDHDCQHRRFREADPEVDRADVVDHALQEAGRAEVEQPPGHQQAAEQARQRGDEGEQRA